MHPELTHFLAHQHLQQPLLPQEVELVDPPATQELQEVLVVEEDLHLEVRFILVVHLHQ